MQPASRIKRSVATPRRSPRAKRALELPPGLFPVEHSVVSMFSGCGGMDLGFLGGFEFLGKTYEKLPYRVVWANDLSPAACKTYKHNLHAIHCGDVWEHMSTLPKKADVVIGGFPCQDVSINGNRNGLNGHRTSLYKAMVETVRRVNPKIFVAENVKGLLIKDDEQPLQKIKDDFDAVGYDVSHHLYLAADYEVPQMRERIFIVGTSRTRRVKPFVHPTPTLDGTGWISAQRAIGDVAAWPESWDTSHVWSKAEVSPEQGDRRLKAEKPGHTIRAECHGNIQWHYELPRRISMREAARIQSFPDTFKFLSKLRETERMIGNAVPPVLAWHVAQSVLKSLAP